MKCADVFFNDLRVKVLAGTRGQLGQLRDLDGVVALNPYFNDSLAWGSGRRGVDWRQ
jgi:hypothetical protein